MKVFRIKVQRSENIGYQLRQWAEKDLKLKNTLHFILQHTFATTSLTYGVDLFTVSKTFSLKILDTTWIYAKIIDEKVNDSIKKLPSL